MLLGLYQCASPAGDVAAGLNVIDTALSQAKAQNVDMLSMPEVFLPGYNAAAASPPPGWDDVLPRLKTMCRDHQTALTIGLAEYDKGHVFNAAYAISDGGDILTNYRKVQLWAEEAKLYQPGDQLVTFDYKGIKFGLLICYDVEFSEHVRALARAGAQVILVPTANMAPFINVNLITVPGKANENGVAIVYANYTGSEGDLDYVGHSAIIGPDGYALASKGMGTGLITAEVPEGLGENGIPYSTQLADLRSVKAPV